MNIAVLMDTKTFECGFSYVGPFPSLADCEAWCYIQNTDHPLNGDMRYVPQNVVGKDWFNDC